MIWRFAIHTRHFDIQCDRDPSFYFFVRVGKYEHEIVYA